MKRPTFFQEVVVAFGLSLVGSGLFVSLAQVTSPDAALKCIITLVAMGYSAHLLSRCNVTSGRVTTAVIWFTVAAACWFGNPPLITFMLVHIGLIWIIRSVFYHCRPVAALLDLILNGLSLAASVWAMLQSESLFMSLWCFFLVQALFVAIPVSLKPLPANNHHDHLQFQSAYRSAEAALGKLSSSVRS